jgi:hypothetical protein
MESGGKKSSDFVAQWYWAKDWKDEWQKAYYVGPREDWMYLMTDDKEVEKDE